MMHPFWLVFLHRERLPLGDILAFPSIMDVPMANPFRLKEYFCGTPGRGGNRIA
jgi:hypothetical protein